MKDCKSKIRLKTVSSKDNGKDFIPCRYLFVWRQFVFAYLQHNKYHICILVDKSEFLNPFIKKVGKSLPLVNIIGKILPNVKLKIK